jgi:hypothetical protein
VVAASTRGMTKSWNHTHDYSNRITRDIGRISSGIGMNGKRCIYDLNA